MNYSIMNTNIPFQRQITLKCIVDMLVGIEDYCGAMCKATPIMDDDFIREFACNMPVNELWWPIIVENCLFNAIDAYGQITHSNMTEKSFSSEELHFMREDFLKRFKSKLMTYSQGKCLAEKTFENGMVGFRWDER